MPKPCARARKPHPRSCVNCKRFPWSRKKTEYSGVRNIPAKCIGTNEWKFWTKCAPFYKTSCKDFVSIKNR